MYCCLQALVKVVFLAAVVGVVGTNAPASFATFNKVGERRLSTTAPYESALPQCA
jgi:hypothetical protein